MATQEARMRALAQRIGQETKAIRALIPASSGSGTAGPGNLETLLAMKATNFDPGMTGGNTGSATNLTLAVKLYTGTAITVNSVTLARDTAGSGHAGYYVAVYDSTGTKLAQSADFSSQITGSVQAFDVALTSAANVPAGMFFVAVRFGTASSAPTFVASQSSNHWRINAGLTWNTTVAASSATAPRLSVPANAWSGATAPATLGLLNGNEYRFPWIGVR